MRQALLPANTLQRAENYVFLYSMGGDSKILVNSQPILEKFISFIPKEEGGFDEALPKGTSLSVLFFLDADKKGIDKRVEELNSEINSNFGVRPFDDHKKVILFNKIKLGAFVFTGLDNKEGKLEDILVPLMAKDNEEIFDNAQKYLTENALPERVKKQKLKYDETKSMIGVAGQLQRSGMSNVVCIGQTDYLTLEKIHTNTKCQEIITFFEEFIST